MLPVDAINLVSVLGRPRVLVLGDAMLDRYTWGHAERVSPEAPVLILQVEQREVRLGGAASVAGLLRGLEAEVTLATVLGDDHDGRTVRRLLAESGIDTEAVLDDPDRPTTLKERYLGKSEHRQPHQMLRVDSESRAALSAKLTEQMLDRIMPRIEDFDAILVSDYGKGVCNDRILTEFIKAGRDLALPVLIDPARHADFARYRQATLVKPNRFEAETAIGRPLRAPEEAVQAANQLRTRHDLDAVVITLDRDGLVFATADQSEHIPASVREICRNRHWGISNKLGKKFRSLATTVSGARKSHKRGAGAR